MPNASPLAGVFVANVPAAIAAASTTTPIVVMPFDAIITGAAYVPSAAITGADTNTRTIAVVDAGPAGSGTDKVAELALTNGVNLAKLDDKALTLGRTFVLAGDTLAFTSTHAASGLADPGGQVIVSYAREVPERKSIIRHVPGRAAAAASLASVLGTSPLTGRIVSVTYTPDADITGANTDSLDATLDLSGGGLGAPITDCVNHHFTSGNNAVKDTALALAVAKVAVEAGEVLTWNSKKVGAGLLDPGGWVTITIMSTSAADITFLRP